MAAAIAHAQVRDMSLNEQDGKLVACSCNNSFVGVWVVDLDKIRPWSGPAVRKAPASQSEQASPLELFPRTASILAQLGCLSLQHTGNVLSTCHSTVWQIVIEERQLID